MIYLISLASEEEVMDYQMESDRVQIDVPSSYRFIMIEGVPNQAELQNHRARKWNIKVMSNWDIIDVENKLFIEVKVTTIDEVALNAFREKAIGMENNSLLVVVNPSTGKLKYYPREIRAQGKDKVTSFILARCQVMRELGISDHQIHEEKDIIGSVFCNSKFVIGFNQWMESFLKHKVLPPPKNIEEDFSDNGSSDLQNFDIKKLEENLIDPLTNGDKPILWKGKILPEGWVKKFYCDDSTDIQLSIDSVA